MLLFLYRCVTLCVLTSPHPDLVLPATTKWPKLDVFAHQMNSGSQVGLSPHGAIGIFETEIALFVVFTSHSQGWL